MKVTYSSNNSGGSWWLSTKDWKALERAGWKVEWEEFLGAKATRASKEGLSLNKAIEEFEEITGQNAEDEGCECCGRPHYFYEE